MVSQIWITMPNFSKSQKLPGFYEELIGQETDVCFKSPWLPNTELFAFRLAVLTTET